MLKKSFAFGLLAAGLMFAPGAALADVQSQNSTQNTVQDGLAEYGSTNAQSSDSLSVQEQSQKIRKRVGRGRSGYGRRYPRPSYCGTSYSGQSQNSSQGTLQKGDAFDNSVNGQSGSSVNDQRQTAARRHSC
ncbi:MAG: hypothetical protein AAFR83_15080 [Cyanobacteria bacterium J06629_18]